MPIPQGMSLNPVSGVLSGTPLDSAAVNGQDTVYEWTIEALSSTGLYARKACSMTVYARPTVTLTTPAGTVGVAYVGSVNATGGSTPRTYSVFAGALPTGLALNAATGAITGTPTLAGVYTGTIRVTAAHNGKRDTAFSITVT